MMSISRGLPKEESRMRGIVAILSPDDDHHHTRPKAASFRRTLSADMSSKQWLSHNGMINKTVSSDHVDSSSSSSSSSSSDGEDSEKTAPGHGRVWTSIMPKPDGWVSILYNRRSDEGGARLPLPYIHPLVKRSARGLSEKSLQVCTESLGSETGSDYLSPEIGFGEEELDQTKKTDRFEEPNIPKYKESPARPFPPPLQSLAGASLRLHSRRRDGRLLLEAVSVPPKRYFHSQRKDGRLTLSLIDYPQSEKNNDAVEETGGGEEEEEEEGVRWRMSVEKTGEAKIEELKEEIDCLWRQKNRNRNKNEEYGCGYGGEMMRSGGGCKEPRRSLSIFPPYCIATS